MQRNPGIGGLTKGERGGRDSDARRTPPSATGTRAGLTAAGFLLRVPESPFFWALTCAPVCSYQKQP